MPSNNTARDIEILVLKLPSVTSRQLAKPDRVSTAARSYHFNYGTMPAGLTPDIVVVRNNCLRKPASFPVSRERTLLLLSEPRSVVYFPDSYVRQFGVVYSCQPELSGANVLYGPAAIWWFVGIGLDGRPTPALADTVCYRALKGAPLPRKTKMMSIIVSNKTFSAGHFARYRFVLKLKARYGDRIDFYGKGFNRVDDKWDALAPYKYTIAIENSVSDTYFTEKVSDAFLAGCHVVYSGCRRIADYFPPEALSLIDIADFDSACRVIDRLLADDPYEDSVEAIMTAKDNVLEKYNILHVIARCCDKVDLSRGEAGVVTLRPISGLGRLHNLFNHLAVWPFWNAIGSLYKVFAPRL